MFNKTVLTFGKAEMIMVMNTSNLPMAGKTVRGVDYAYAPGGRGGLAAVTLAAHSVGSVFCARLGSDENGATLINYFDGCNVDTRYMTKDGSEPTGFSVTINEANNCSRNIIFPGANEKFGREEIESAFMCYPDAVYLQMDLPDRDIIAATRMAACKRVPVFLDAGPRKMELPMEKLENVEVFSPNENEVYAYTGVFPNTPDTSLKACMQLASKVKAKYVVLKLGERGCFIYDGSYYDVVPSYDTTFVDGSGVGDVFTAALTAEYIRNGGDIQRACKYANMAGAVMVSREGSYSAIPDRRAVESFANRLGVRLD